MFKGFASLRAILTFAVHLRGIHRELTRIGDLLDARLKLEHPEWYKSGGLKSKPTRLAHISTANVQVWNDRWRDRHPDPSDE